MQGEETKIRGRRRHAKLWRALAAAGIATVGVVGTASMAGAARYPDGGEVDSIQVSDPGDPGSSSSVKVAGKTQTRGQLPFTGGDVTALAWMLSTSPPSGYRAAPAMDAVPTTPTVAIPAAAKARQSFAWRRRPLIFVSSPCITCPPGPFPPWSHDETDLGHECIEPRDGPHDPAGPISARSGTGLPTDGVGRAVHQ